jgi:pimeloyl-ACP methyl ester carboxylesterase
MATFVAVHGAFFGGWVWKPLAKLLEARGHTVHRITLSGCAEREHVGSVHVGLDTHIQDIVSYFEMEELQDVILIGHSYGGMPVAGATQKLHERLRGLIHFDAFLPQNGERARDYFPVATYDRGAALAAETGEGWNVPFFLPLDRFCPEDHPMRPWLTRQLKGVPLKPFSDPVSITRDVSSIPMLFIYCKADALGMFESSRDRAYQRPNTRVVEMNTQHAAMLTKTSQVADLFDSFASSLTTPQLQ